jgi:hypothetical protein
MHRGPAIGAGLCDQLLAHSKMGNRLKEQPTGPRAQAPGVRIKYQSNIESQSSLETPLAVLSSEGECQGKLHLSRRPSSG